MRTCDGAWLSRTVERRHSIRSHALTHHAPNLLDSALHDGCGLRVAFDWQADRYAHQLICLVDGSPTPLLSSIEGIADERWPASPPFQQLSIEEGVDESRVAFLVGMAGQSHWSASIQVAADRPRVEFDVACLARDTASHLGSAYRREIEPSSEDTGQITFSLANGCLIKLNVTGIENEPPGRLQSDDAQIAISCGWPRRPAPVTHRWKYTIEMAPGYPQSVE